jgi:hypothetical protein
MQDMKIRWHLLVFALSLPSWSCELTGLGARNLYAEAARIAEEHRQRALYRATAEHIWAGGVHEPAPGVCPDAFREGFLDGFVDYLEAGGSGQPVLPPLDYRFGGEKYPPEAGHQWLAGFRHGADVARHTGLREKSLVAVGLPPPAGPPPPLILASAAPAHAPHGPVPHGPIAPAPEGWGGDSPPTIAPPRGLPEAGPEREVLPSPLPVGPREGESAPPAMAPPTPRINPVGGLVLAPAPEAAPALPVPDSPRSVPWRYFNDLSACTPGWQVSPAPPPPAGPARPAPGEDNVIRIHSMW